MFGRIKRQCIYKALHRKLSERSRRVVEEWTAARLAGSPCSYYAMENVRLHKMLERAESKMWWITRKML